MHNRSNVRRRSLASIMVAASIAAGCGGGDDGDAVGTGDGTIATSPETVPGTDEAISVGELLDEESQGRPGTNVVVVAMLVDDGEGIRMCEALAESFPPQCGGRSISVLNPEAVDVQLTEAQGVRWTDDAVWLVGWVEDGSFFVS